MTPVKSRNNERFKALLAARNDKALLMLEGRRLVVDALARGCEPVFLAVTPSYVEIYGSPALDSVLLDKDLFSKISDTRTPQGIIAFVKRPYRDIEEMARHDRLVILDGLQDPGNVGAIVRTAEAFGFGGLIITPGTASPFTEKALRASMGSVMSVDIAQAGAGEIAALGHRIIGLVVEKGVPINSGMFSGRFAVCLGQEGSGLGADMLSLSSERVFIPMKGRTESLNVAVAAGIVMAIAAGAAK